VVAQVDHVHLGASQVSADAASDDGAVEVVVVVVVWYGEREGQGRVAQSPGHEPPVVARAQQPVQAMYCVVVCACVSCVRVSCVVSEVHYFLIILRDKENVPDEVPTGLLVLAAAQGGIKAGLVGGQR
jgi:hypothetical protein